MSNGSKGKELPSAKEIEEGTLFWPRFDRSSLLPCVTVDARTGRVLMVAYMNREALERTLRTRRATFFSRSRQALWVKGETSGCYLDVVEVLVDCDQDALLVKVIPRKEEDLCHTGRSSCFYRRVVGEEEFWLEHV